MADGQFWHSFKRPALPSLLVLTDPEKYNTALAMALHKAGGNAFALAVFHSPVEVSTPPSSVNGPRKVDAPLRNPTRHSRRTNKKVVGLREYCPKKLWQKVWSRQRGCRSTLSRNELAQILNRPVSDGLPLGCSSVAHPPVTSAIRMHMTAT